AGDVAADPHPGRRRARGALLRAAVAGGALSFHHEIRLPGGAAAIAEGGAAGPGSGHVLGGGVAVVVADLRGAPESRSVVRAGAAAPGVGGAVPRHRWRDGCPPRRSATRCGGSPGWADSWAA